MEEILKIENVGKIYKSSSLFFRKKANVALKDINFSIYKGEIFGLVGESGSGKTTLANIILRLIKANQGKVFFKGKDISKFSKEELFKYRRELQVVFQNPYSALNPKKTIGFALKEILNIHNLYSEEEKNQRVSKVLKDIELEEDILNQYPGSLSGGQKQRIAIGQALIINPEFLIIDEGVSALDVSIQAQILNLIKSLQEEYNFTCLFISHDLNVISYLCDRIGVLYKGELVDLFKTEELKNQERNEYTKKLFSSIKFD
ncbi:ABC transporter ATP-binding protein [Peptoniphilus gorbachii]|uniref:ABC-type glutathione transport system ATPase component n=1 Tax=Peptoniphilus gorbachii TaxID=411567 RepID=A0ABS2MMC3_9FIRM|nr:ATP-binding cassette domain-containing protein [Peptoniphilus gorbachii]MBM7551096.1 ABC-type glutathione transport system ATPase component [Peptoniphilus gorbachii]MDU1664434.1 ATP-binding cassette domain-containing protein [Peptoniphilus harei]